MKKLAFILLTITLSFAFITGCSKDDTKTPSSNNNETDTPIDQETETDDDNSIPVQEDSDNTDVSVDDILNAIKTAYGDDYLPNIEIAPDILEAEFGLTPDMYETVKAEQPMIGTHADRVVIVKATEGRASDVEAALNVAREKKINDTLQYPMNLPKINAAKVVRNGNYVCFLLVGSTNNMDSSEEEAKQFAEKEVEKAVNAFNDLFK